MTDGFRAEQINGIAIYTFTNNTEAAIDTWAATLVQWIESIPPNTLFRILMDVSSNQVTFSRYARQKSLEVFGRYRNRRGRCAFLFSSRTAPFYSRIFFASLGRLEFQLGYFNNRQKALEWLREA
jgi:hypothetical protein